MSSPVDARLQLPEMLDGVREVRRLHADAMEVRETNDGTLRYLGYGSVTEHAYDIGDPAKGGFTETIAAGAFRRTLSENPDVVLLINHGADGKLPLARTKSGTMTLTEDDRGLRVEADLDPDDPDVRALVPKIRRGDVSEMSFAFRVTSQTWSEDRSKRRITGVTLHKGDMSIVTYGASDATSAGFVVARSDDGLVEVRALGELTADRQARLRRVLNGTEPGVRVPLVDPLRRAREQMAVLERRESVRRQLTRPHQSGTRVPDYTTPRRERLEAILAMRRAR